MQTETIVHKAGKVVSYLIMDGDNLVEGRTYKDYGSYYRTVERMTDAVEQQRLLRNLPLCFDHECDIIALANRKGLPAVKLVGKRPGQLFEMEYLASSTLQQCLESPATGSVGARHLITATFHCLQRFDGAGFVLVDTHPSNWLVSPTGLISFCDLGNSFSPQELPFRAPPLATGNRRDETYFAQSQHLAFVADRAMDREKQGAPYSADRLASNRLGAQDDLFVFAYHVLRLTVRVQDRNHRLLEQYPLAQVLDPHLKEILEAVVRGEFTTAEQILGRLHATASAGAGPTPEIGTEDVTIQSGIRPRQTLPRWTSAGAALAKRYLPGASRQLLNGAICVGVGLIVGGIYQGYRQQAAQHRAEVSPVAEQALVTRSTGSQAVAPVLVPGAAKQPERLAGGASVPGTQLPAQAGGAPVAVSVPVPLQQNNQQAVVRAAELLRHPVSSASYRSGIKGLTRIASPEASAVLERELERARTAARSGQFPLADSGIRTLHLLARMQIPVSSQASAALGELIKLNIEAGPSEETRQRLGLLASLGNVRAHQALGCWSEEPKGLPGRDLAAAYRHYAAASRKLPEASQAVARLESSAPELVKTPATQQDGFRLLLAIADAPRARNRAAQYAVGRILALGLYGQAPNRPLAGIYLQRAAGNGSAEAGALLRQLRLKG